MIEKNFENSLCKENISLRLKAINDEIKKLYEIDIRENEGSSYSFRFAVEFPYGDCSGELDLTIVFIVDLNYYDYKNKFIMDFRYAIYEGDVGRWDALLKPYSMDKTLVEGYTGTLNQIFNVIKKEVKGAYKIARDYRKMFKEVYDFRKHL